VRNVQTVDLDRVVAPLVDAVLRVGWAGAAHPAGFAGVSGAGVASVNPGDGLRGDGPVDRGGLGRSGGRRGAGRRRSGYGAHRWPRILMNGAQNGTPASVHPSRKVWLRTPAATARPITTPEVSCGNSHVPTAAIPNAWTASTRGFWTGGRPRTAR